jgi:hypothetical protein
MRSLPLTGWLGLEEIVSHFHDVLIEATPLNARDQLRCVLKHQVAQAICAEPLMKSLQVMSLSPTNIDKEYIGVLLVVVIE